MHNLNGLALGIYIGNKFRGFDASKANIGQTLMLIVTELAEAMEAHRNNSFVNWIKFDAQLASDKCTYNDIDLDSERMPQAKRAFENNVKDTFEDEIADSIIRLFDLCGALDIDIEKHIKLKLQFNSTREFKHGKQY